MHISLLTYLFIKLIIYIYIYIYIYLFIYFNFCSQHILIQNVVSCAMHKKNNICLYTHTYMYIHTHIYIYIYRYTYIYTHTHIYTYIHIYTHTYTHILVWDRAGERANQFVTKIRPLPIRHNNYKAPKKN